MVQIKGLTTTGTTGTVYIHSAEPETMIFKFSEAGLHST